MRKKYVATIGIIIFMFLTSSIQLTSNFFTEISNVSTEISNISTGSSKISTRSSNTSIGISIPKVSTENLNDSNSTDGWSMFGGNLQHTSSISQIPSNSSGFYPIWSSNVTFDDTYQYPSAANGYVYCSNNASFYCFDAYSGNLTWSYSPGSYIDTTSAIEEGNAYFGTYNGEIYCLNAINGDFVWKYNVSSIYSSPLIFNGKLYIGSDSVKDFYCLNATNGSLVWEHQIDAVSQSSPSEYAGNIYFGTNNGSMYCLNSTYGNTIWKYQTGSLIQISPSEYDDKVYFGNENNTEYCLNAITGNLIWTRSFSSLELSVSQCLSNGRVYIAYNNLCCLDAETGQVLWNDSISNGCSNTPLISNGILYIGGWYYFYFINATTGKDIWDSWNWNWEDSYDYYAWGGICSAFGYLYYIANEKLICLPMILAPTRPNNVQIYYNNYPDNAYETTSYKGMNYSVCNLQLNYVPLKWSPPDSNGGSPVIGYKIYRNDTSNGSFVCIATLGNVTNYNDTSVLYGHTYYYKISSFNKYGESHKSEDNNLNSWTIPDPPESLIPRFHFSTIELVIIFIPSIALIIHITIKTKKSAKENPSR